MTAEIAMSDYSNNPTRGGVEEIRFGNVGIFKTSVGEMDNNVYLLVDRRAPEKSLLIDAANDAEHLKALIAATGATVTTIVTTHSHGDHIVALPALLESTGARHLTSELDAVDIPVPADALYGDGGTIEFGAGIALRTFLLRGHTKGGLCLDLSAAEAGADSATSLADDSPSHHLFVGDSLFPGGVGGTNNDADFQRLLGDVVKRVFEVYPGDAVVHPGHGKDTTVGAERPHVDQWRERGW
nr:MBL fold metallo-hydrolase [Corynebacterium lactis]